MTSEAVIDEYKGRDKVRPYAVVWLRMSTLWSIMASDRWIPSFAVAVERTRMHLEY
jgi:hypothetical protein